MTSRKCYLKRKEYQPTKIVPLRFSAGTHLSQTPVWESQSSCHEYPQALFTILLLFCTKRFSSTSNFVERVAFIRLGRFLESLNDTQTGMSVLLKAPVFSTHLQNGMFKELETLLIRFACFRLSYLC